ncbi:helix-turn-helix domain-containing protein [Streptomyces sp. NPDC001780]
MCLQEALTYGHDPSSVCRVPADEHDESAWVLARRYEIGRHIREARLYANRTQEELGAAIGRERRAVHRYETGAHVPSLTLLLRISYALDVPLAHLVREVEPRPASTGDDARPGR